MKKLIIAITIATMSLMAVDYSQMSTEELNSLRGTVAAEDREAFRAEMHSRFNQMTPDEQAKFMEDRQATRGQGLRDGSGAGSMSKGSKSQGQGMGQRLKDGSGAGSMGQGSRGNGKGRN